MKKIITFMLVLFSIISSGITKKDSTKLYKKPVLDAAEIDLLMSYYAQDGDHSSVGGGVGSEELTDITPTIVITLPLNDDDILTIDTGLSAYTSASSSNVNPFNSSGASKSDDDENHGNSEMTSRGSPWVSSSGASRSDELIHLSINYSHSSDDRNFIWGANIAFANEYDYGSVGFGGDVALLLNEKNTEINLKTQVYLDNWKPIYPTELNEYNVYGSSFLSSGYFSGVDVYNQHGAATNQYKPEFFKEFTKDQRNSFSASLGVSQIITERMQASLFVDFIYQTGLLSTPFQRVYFADKYNYYIGNSSDIERYTSRKNKGVFHLADDVERLPDSRLKIPIGTRVNIYISETFKLRTYYRYYSDDWNISGHTVNIELPVKLSERFAIIPSYRCYMQTATNYFAPYNKHFSSDKYYTSDYDLSAFHSNQLGLGLRYTDLFSEFKLYRVGLRNLNLNYSHYNRSNGLKANIVSFGIKLALE